MRRNKRLLLAIPAVMLLGLQVLVPWLQVSAETTNAPSLVISQLKISSSNGQFVTLYNATNATLDMSKYQLQYFNSYDLAKATSSKLIALAGMVPPHSYFMVNDSELLLCYQLSVDSVSLGLSSTAGLLQVLALNQSNPGGSITPGLQDHVGWSKTAAIGAQTLPANPNAFLLRQPVDSKNNPLVASPGAGFWQTVQPDGSNACSLVTVTTNPVSVPIGLSQLLPATEPPATIVSLAADTSSSPKSPSASLPNADIGLMVPRITELLPNPAGSGMDAADEFIELYNPNNSSFDLTGFSLQVGTTRPHSFAFPPGSSLPAQSFTAFYSIDTGLSLSNSGGQARLLDPFANIVSSCDIYTAAKDGQAWALANGKWYYTLKPTPDAANTIEQPPLGQKTAKAKAKAKAKAIATAKPKSSKSSASTHKVATSAHAKATAARPKSNLTASSTPIHVWILALVASLALLYGAYEYRADLANRIFQLRRYIKHWRGYRA